jgi:CRISPR-associated protein Cmr1
MRKPPDIKPPETITAQQSSAIITQIREYQLITPLYGGGVKPTEADPVTVVRATQIRGQLRFWWRACRYGKFNDDLKELRKEEEAIWGKAYKKREKGIPPEQTIQIMVEALPKSTRDDDIAPFKIETTREGRLRSRYDPETRIPAYAAFPLQHTEEELQQAEPPVKKVRDNVKFRLTISFPSARKAEVEAALWAWETFGGIGARTRRGFGALRCLSIIENKRPEMIDLPPANRELAQQWMQEKLVRYVVEGAWTSTLPHLKARGVPFKIVSRGNVYDSLSVWRDLITRLRDFRQSRYPSTRPGANSPGRSMWPEPSAIRHLTGQSLPPHAAPIPDPLVEKFPRAAFGLPIIFQFKDRSDHNPDDKSRDPRKTVLQLKTSERLASPLVLKPLACQNGSYLGLALILEGTGVEGEDLLLKTQKGQKEEWNVNAALDPGESLIIAYPGSPSIISVDAHTNALQAFLKYL